MAGPSGAVDRGASRDDEGRELNNPAISLKNRGELTMRLFKFFALFLYYLAHWFPNISGKSVWFYAIAPCGGGWF
jgi:hypothetical protein